MIHKISWLPKSKSKASGAHQALLEYSSDEEMSQLWIRQICKKHISLKLTPKIHQSRYNLLKQRHF